MANERSPEFRVRVFGPLACFTRPEMKAERVSYEVMTPSAARGVLEAILWKPAIRWVVRAIEVHAPIAFASFKRNEVNTRVRTPSAAHVAGRDAFDPYFADEDRAQRNTLALRDVDYVVRAIFVMTERADRRDARLAGAERRVVLRGLAATAGDRHGCRAARRNHCCRVPVPRTGGDWQDAACTVAAEVRELLAARPVPSRVGGVHGHHGCARSVPRARDHREGQRCQALARRPLFQGTRPGAGTDARRKG
jgi:CRISPR-associated protein Cas5 subtype I-C